MNATRSRRWRHLPAGGVRGLAIAQALALALFTQASLAQEDPIVIGQKEKRDTFRLENVHGALDFLFRHQSDKNTQPAGDSTQFTENRFEETLSLSATGFIIHPNLVDLSLSGAFGLRQADVDDDGTDNSQNTTIEQYDATATLLRKRIAPLTLYSRRSRELVERSFAGSLDSIITTHGGILDIRAQELPTQVQFFHMNQQLLDPQGVDLNIDQDSFQWHSEYLGFPQQRLSWDYAFSNVEQDTQDLEGAATGENFQTHEAALTHSWDFGAGAGGNVNNLSSALTYFQQAGAFALDRLTWNETLRLEHTPRLQTSYRYDLSMESFNGVDQTQHRGQVGLRHKLYESLVTNVSAGALMLDRSDGQRTTEQFASLGLDYRKKVPFGRITASASVAGNFQQNEQGAQEFLVLNEPHTFVDGGPVILTRSGIIASTLVLMQGVITLTEGVDYEVDVIGQRVEVRPLPGGSISFIGQDVVLFSYRVESQPSNDTTTFSEGIAIRYDIEQGPLAGLGLFARYFQQDQDISAEVESSTLIEDSIRDLTLGADYRFWRMAVGAEHQMHESVIAPYDATRLFARYSDRVAANTVLSIFANYNIIEYPDVGNEVRVLILSAHAQQRFTKALSGNLRLVYRHEQDDLRGDSEGFEQHAEVRWKHRQLSVFVQGRNALFTSDSQERSAQTIEFGLRREF